MILKVGHVNRIYSFDQQKPRVDKMTTWLYNKNGTSTQHFIIVIPSVCWVYFSSNSILIIWRWYIECKALQNQPSSQELMYQQIFLVSKTFHPSRISIQFAFGIFCTYDKNVLSCTCLIVKPKYQYIYTEDTSSNVIMHYCSVLHCSVFLC